MKKIILITLLFIGTGITSIAQKTATATAAQTAYKPAFDPITYKQNAAKMEVALKADKFKEAMDYFPIVQRMLIQRSDDFTMIKKPVEAKKWHDLGYEMKGYALDIAHNKEKMLAVIAKSYAAL